MSFSCWRHDGHLSCFSLVHLIHHLGRVPTFGLAFNVAGWNRHYSIHSTVIGWLSGYGSFSRVYQLKMAIVSLMVGDCFGGWPWNFWQLAPISPSRKQNNDRRIEPLPANPQLHHIKPPFIPVPSDVNSINSNDRPMDLERSIGPLVCIQPPASPCLPHRQQLISTNNMLSSQQLDYESVKAVWRGAMDKMQRANKSVITRKIWIISAPAKMA